ncbi:MAG: hypothetical protein ABIK28_05495, partial [Planctomycetota bacterium]
MKRIFLSLFLISSVALTLELSLVRLFDVLLNPSFCFLVLTCALFSMGLAGVYGAFRPPSASIRSLAGTAGLLGVFIALLFPLLHIIPFRLYS